METSLMDGVTDLCSGQVIRISDFLQFGTRTALPLFHFKYS
jgi:hypothetical protein